MVLPSGDLSIRIPLKGPVVTWWLRELFSSDVYFLSSRMTALLSLLPAIRTTSENIYSFIHCEADWMQYYQGTLTYTFYYNYAHDTVELAESKEQL